MTPAVAFVVGAAAVAVKAAQIHAIVKQGKQGPFKKLVDTQRAS